MSGKRTSVASIKRGDRQTRSSRIMATWKLTKQTRLGATKRFANALLGEKKLAFMTVYLTALDHTEHASGPFGKESLAVLERLDAVVGQLRQTAEEQGPVVVCVVSDHGFAKTDKDLNLNSALRQAGLIELGPDGSVKSWRASAWLAGGSAAIVLKDAADSDANTRVRKVLNEENPEMRSSLVSGWAWHAEGILSRNC